jgi:hypothetical protein
LKFTTVSFYSPDKLLGNSILISGIATSLAGYPNLSVTRLDRAELEIDVEASALGQHPVIVYDTNLESPGDMLDLIRRVPGLVLIGLDADTQNVLVVSGQFSPLVNVEELAGVIQSSCQ